MGERLYSFLRSLVVACMFVGILGMIRPWYLPLLKPGFQVLLASTLAHIILSHMTPRAQDSSTDMGRPNTPVSLVPSALPRQDTRALEKNTV